MSESCWPAKKKCVQRGRAGGMDHGWRVTGKKKEGMKRRRWSFTDREVICAGVAGASYLRRGDGRRVGAVVPNGWWGTGGRSSAQGCFRTVCRRLMTANGHGRFGNRRRSCLEEPARAGSRGWRWTAVDEWPAGAGAAVASLYVQMAVTWPRCSGREGHAGGGIGER